MKRALMAFAAALLLCTGVAGAVTQQSGSPSGCPSAARCGIYKLNPERWPSVHGSVTIHYRVNPVQPWITPMERAISAIGAAAAAWERANPSVHLIYDGLTYDAPQIGDGVNEIAWTPALDSGTVAETNHRARGKKRLEADTLLDISTPWGWTPCEQRNGSCTDVSESALRHIDLQAAMTHEFGHWLGIESVDAPAASELTMFSTIRFGERKQDTLALGDSLAVRVAYPSRTRMPTIVSP